MNPENNTEAIKVKTFPEDFPRPIDFSKEVGEKSVQQRDARKSGIEDYDEKNFFFADGSIDEDWITNVWYALSTHGLRVGDTKPEKIEIQNFGQLSSISFSEYFSQSSAFKQMMNRPDEDPKRAEVINYMDDFVMKTFGSELRSRIDSVPGLREKIANYLHAGIKRGAYFMREGDKWTKKMDNSEEEPVELKRFQEISNEVDTLQNEITEILIENKLW